MLYDLTPEERGIASRFYIEQQREEAIRQAANFDNVALLNALRLALFRGSTNQTADEQVATIRKIIADVIAQERQEIQDELFSVHEEERADVSPPCRS